MMDGRTVLLSENRLFRDGIRQMLLRCHINVIGEGRGVLDLLQDLSGEAEPELVIFHLASGQWSDSPLAVLRNLHEHFARAKLVVLADPCTRPILPSLVQADVSAILSTQISSDMLQRSLELVRSDHRLFPADILLPASGDRTTEPSPPIDQPPPRISAATDGQRGAVPADPAQARALSRREYQVVQCLAGGLSNKTIARQLHITEGTVKVHIKGLLRKLRAANRTQLAIWALRQTPPAP